MILLVILGNIALLFTILAREHPVNTCVNRCKSLVLRHLPLIHLKGGLRKLHPPLGLVRSKR